MLWIALQHNLQSFTCGFIQRLNVQTTLLLRKMAATDKHITEMGYLQISLHNYLKYLQPHMPCSYGKNILEIRFIDNREYNIFFKDNTGIGRSILFSTKIVTKL